MAAELACGAFATQTVLLRRDRTHAQARNALTTPACAAPDHVPGAVPASLVPCKRRRSRTIGATGRGAAHVEEIRTDDLTIAPEINQTIGVAPGVLSDRYKINRELAFNVLRISSQRPHRKRSVIATLVAEARELPIAHDELNGVLRHRRYRAARPLGRVAAPL